MSEVLELEVRIAELLVEVQALKGAINRLNSERVEQIREHVQLRRQNQRMADLLREPLVVDAYEGV